MKTKFFFLSMVIASAIPQFTFAKEQKETIVVGKLTAWIGKSKSDLEKHSKYGDAPSKTVAKDGKTTVTYRQIFNVTGSVEQGDIKTSVNCLRSFTYNSKNKITAVSEEGTCNNTSDYLPDDNTK